jgi:PPM family protein phosphatase
MELMTIGDFAARTRLSAKALRLYDRLGLLRPAQTDPVSGYRRYSADQVETARLVGLLRRLGMPLAAIADVLAMPPAGAAEAIEAYWAAAEAQTADRRELAGYLQARQGRAAAGPLRQVMFADQRTAAPGTLVCDLTVPLR